jgi:TatD DNase family protein
LSYVDAHLHLADPGYTGKIEMVLDDSAKNNVRYLLSNGVDYDSSIRTLALAEQYENRVLAAVGIHPWTVTNTQAELDLNIFEKLLEENKTHITAIGEIGLDGQYSQDEIKKTRQHETFQYFLGLAERHRLPVIIHSRLAIEDVLATLPSFSLPRVMLHWYSGPLDNLRLIKDRNYLITVGPSILYSKRTAEIARHADLDTILTETDGPVNYFGPFKGRQTLPSFVLDVVKKLAQIRNENIDDVRNALWNNSHSLMSCS